MFLYIIVLYVVKWLATRDGQLTGFTYYCDIFFVNK